jgi:hypothetical protein
MIQYSLLGRTAASSRLNTTFRGLAPSPSSGKSVLPEDGDGARRLYGTDKVLTDSPTQATQNEDSLMLLQSRFFALVNTKAANVPQLTVHFLCVQSALPSSGTLRNSFLKCKIKTTTDNMLTSHLHVRSVHRSIHFHIRSYVRTFLQNIQLSLHSASEYYTI